MENKHLKRKNFTATNQGFNPQYKWSPLHICDIHPPFYIEDELEELIPETSVLHGKLYSSFSNEGQEVRTYEEEDEALYAKLDDDEIDDY